MNKLTIKNFEKFLYFIVLFCLTLQNVLAQSKVAPNVTPPSPEAASLGKFVEVPVSHYTGLPNIKIPLYSIESGEIKLPIEISYHARGIQVSEIASQVGTGWTLMAGGAVIRQVRGRADETPFGYITQNYYSTFFTSRATREQVLAGVSAGTGDQTIDLEPDVYFFNFLNFSGKFIFDQITKKPVIQKFSDFKIEPVYETGYYIKGWVITDKDGIKYYFGTSQDGLRTAIDKPSGVSSYQYLSQAGGLQQPTSGPINNSAWQLLDIITPSAKHIKFEYVKDKPVYFVKNSDEGTSGNITSSFSKMFMDQCHIKTIYFDKGKIVFTKASIAREDLASSFALEKVEVFGSDNVLKTKHVFNYRYTNSEDINSLDFLRTSEPQAKKRLFLESIITEGSVASTKDKKHSFIYNAEVLPNRFSTAQDSWGYYNGKSNGTFSSFFENDNRQVDTIKSEAGMLKKITYPTGGSATFEYEHNKVIPARFYKDLLTNPSTPKVPRTFSMFKDPEYYASRVYRKTFTVNGDPLKNITLYSNINLGSNAGSCSTTSNNANCPFDVYVYQTNPRGLVGSLYTGSTGYIILKPGEYEVEVRPKTLAGHNPEDYENDAFWVRLNWEEFISNENEILFAAGKRIKRIVWDDNLGGSTYKTYKYLDSSGKSSGKTFSIPNMYYISRVVNGMPVIDMFGATAGSPLTNFQGNSLGYSFVTEIDGEKNNNIGKTEYTFTMPEDTGDYYKFPYHAPTDNEWLRGMPLNIKYYSHDLNTYSLVKEITNRYLYGGEAFSPIYFTEMIDPDLTYLYLNHRRKFSFPLILFIKDESLEGNAAYNNPNSYKTYYTTGGPVDLLSSKEIEYMKNSGEYQVSTEYTYNYDSNYQVKSTQTKSSNQKILETKYFYASDSEMASEPFRSELIASNRIGMPLEIQNSNNSIKVSDQKTIYDKSVSTSNLLLPRYALGNKGPAVLNIATDRKIAFDQYDAKGNILQYTIENGNPVSIIWGYDKTQPIAKIENATNAQIATTLGVSDISVLNETNLAAINNLRSSVPNSIITTYTHIPLVGVSTITDPKGDVMTYTYDSFGRLQFVKDKNNNILSENQYNYKQ